MKFHRIISVLPLLPMLFSCEEPFMGTATYIEISGETRYEVPAEGTTIEMSVKTDGKTLNCNSSAWITATYYFDKRLVIEVPVNPSRTSREGEVVLSYRGTDPVTITIVQAAATVEGDPYAPENGYDMPWDDSWTVAGFIYQNASPGPKYEPYMYGENGLPASTSLWYTANSAEAITLGVKLEQPMLDYFKGKKIIKMELNADYDMVKTIRFAVVEVVKVTDDADAPEWRRGKMYSQTKVLWEGDGDRSGNADWPCAELGEGAVDVPASGDIMCVAYMTGEKDARNGKSMVRYAPQHISKFAPCYISLDGNNGKNMFVFSGGTLPFNIYFSK